MEPGSDARPVEAPPAVSRRRLLPLALVAAVALLLVAGAVAAFAVPVFSMSSSRGLASMLPATTAGYVSVDLNPSGANRANWDRIIHAFTDQPGWKHVADLYSQTSRSSNSAGDCYRQTDSQVTNDLGMLGHTSGFALLSANGFSRAAGAESALTNSIVFLGALDVHMTLAQAVSGFSLSLPSHATTYRGVDIYRETFASCGQLGFSAPQTVYAALDRGYVILGVHAGPIERVIDVAEGATPSLSSRSAYTRLMAQIPGGSLAGAYLNGTAWKQVQQGQLLMSELHAPAAVASTVAGVYATADGLRISSASTTSNSRHVQSVGQLASRLPDSTLAFASFSGLGRSLRALAAALRSPLPLGGVAGHTTAPLLSAFSAHMYGETDLVVGQPSVPAAGPSLLISLLWQEPSAAMARADLRRITHRIDANDRFRTALARDGTRYAVTSGQFGYAVRRRWAILSLQIPTIVNQLAARPTAPLSNSAAVRDVAAPGSATTSLVYVNLRGVRLALERQLLPRFGGATSYYRSVARPFLLPLQSFTARSSVGAGGRYAVETAEVRIGT